MWDPRMIERSKTVVPGVPPRFTLANQFRAIAPFDVSALAELDGQILVLGVDGLAVMPADGPNDQGLPALSAPTILSSLGLLEGGEMAVIRIPMGVIFPGKRGLYIAPRGGGDPEFIGSPVQEDLAVAYGACEFSEPASSNSPGSRLVAFAVESVSGVRRLGVLDQDTLQWVSVDALPSPTPAAPGAAEVIGSFADRPVFIQLDSTAAAILTQSTNRGADDNGSGAWVVSVETAHVRPFGLLGWGYVRRVQLLVTLPTYSPADPPTLTLYFGRDGAGLVAMSSQLPTQSGVVALEWQLPGDQPCNSFRFRVDATAIGAGPILHGLSLDVDAAPGLSRLPVGQRT
jgi:hypothetical protein